MCQIMEESCKEYAKQQTYQIAMNLIRMGMGSEEDIARATDLTIEDVRELVELVKANS